MSADKQEPSVTVELVKGNGCGEGLYMDDNRIAGSKPMPGGQTIRTWTVSVSEIRAILRRASAQHRKKT